MVFGVGNWLAYRYTKSFTENESVEVARKKIIFPCFNNNSFYFYVHEYDEYEYFEVRGGQR